LAFFGQPKWCCDLRVRRPKTKACRPWKASTLVSSSAITGRQPSSRLPPSPPAEKATAREDQAREVSTGDWTGRCHFLDNRCEWPIKAAAESRPTKQTLRISRLSPGRRDPVSDSPPRQDFAFNLSDKRCLCNTVGGRIGRIVEGCAAYRCAVTAARSRSLTMTNFARSSLALVLRAVFGGAKSCALVKLFMICPPVGSRQSTTAKISAPGSRLSHGYQTQQTRDPVLEFGSQIEKRLRLQPPPSTGGPRGVTPGPDFEKEKNPQKDLFLFLSFPFLISLSPDSAVFRMARVCFSQCSKHRDYRIALEFGGMRACIA
jgi:hypothetical protein